MAFNFENINRCTDVMGSELIVSSKKHIGMILRSMCEIKYVLRDPSGKKTFYPGVAKCRPVPFEGPWHYFEVRKRFSKSFCGRCSAVQQGPIYHGEIDCPVGAEEDAVTSGINVNASPEDDPERRRMLQGPQDITRAAPKKLFPCKFCRTRCKWGYTANNHMERYHKDGLTEDSKYPDDKKKKDAHAKKKKEKKKEKQKEKKNSPPAGSGSDVAAVDKPQDRNMVFVDKGDAAQGSEETEEEARKEQKDAGSGSDVAAVDKPQDRNMVLVDKGDAAQGSEETEKEARKEQKKQKEKKKKKKKKKKKNKGEVQSAESSEEVIKWGCPCTQVTFGRTPSGTKLPQKQKNRRNITVGMRCAHSQMHGWAVNGSSCNTRNHSKIGDERKEKRRLGQIRRAWSG